MSDRVHPGALVLVTAALACAPGPDPDGAATFESVFQLVGMIELEESGDDPIVAIEQVGRRTGGGFILTDEASGRVRLFDSAGRLERVIGRPGDGPGELEGPTGAAETEDGRVLVVQRANPRVSVFTEGDSTLIGRLPGQYGFWADRVGDRIVAGVGSRTERFALLTNGGQPVASFGRVDPSVVETPFWIFFASENAAVVGNEIAINTSFFPRIRFFDANGDSVRTVGVPPPSWIQPMAPPVDGLSQAAARERIDEWSRGFTVVRDIAAIQDSLVVVGYGRHAPVDRQPYRVLPYALDVYSRGGAKLAEDVEQTRPIVGGGAQLIVLAAEPPAPWTLAIYEWRGGGG